MNRSGRSERSGRSNRSRSYFKPRKNFRQLLDDLALGILTDPLSSADLRPCA